ncbi:MAG: two-component sensor histidine kinase [Thermoleophilaceae bacterium]|nr:two-component sensor histidine kinase [Thermoleophilaceae bacterium]
MRPPRSVLVDVGLGAALYVAVAVDEAAEGGLSAEAALLAVPPCAALLARRRAPLPVLAVTLATAILYASTGHEEFPMAVTVLLALFSVGERHDWPVALVAAAATAVIAFMAGQQLDDVPRFSDRNVVELGWCFAAFGLGAAVRIHHAYMAEAVDRATRAERARDEEARRRVAEERLRIARELHDVTGHAIATINVQAGVAAHLLEDDPAEARVALSRVRQASSTALGEMRRTLGLLRAGDPSDTPAEPIRGVDEISQLVERARADGLPVTLELHVEADQPLPAVIGLTVYRIVQEALTNVAKHAHAPTAVAVRVRRDDGMISVDVIDDGDAVPDDDDAPSGGQGLQGMRERVSAVGGRLEVGPRQGGGFEVHANIPVAG